MTSSSKPTPPHGRRNPKFAAHLSVGASTSRSGAIPRIAIGPNTLRRAQREIAFCEHCHPHDSELPFDWLLMAVTGECGHTSSFWASLHVVIGIHARSSKMSVWPQDRPRHRDYSKELAESCLISNSLLNAEKTQIKNLPADRDFASEG